MAMVSVVGGAFLSASLQVLFDRLASREVLTFFIKGTRNVPELLEKLKRKLVLLNGVLDDADVTQFTDKTVKAWSDEARDAVYQADDLVGEIAYEALRCKVEADHDYGSSSSQVKNLISSSSTPFNVAIEPKLEKIIQLLEDLVKDADFLGLKKGVRRVTMSNKHPSSSLVVESDVCGRISEKEELIKLLLSDEAGKTDSEVGVIPVVGMGGLGKTTLAQLAYNDDRVNRRFQLKAWACVSEDFDVLRVSKTILESITKCICHSTDLNQVQESLKEKLEGRKFLVVLDDVWNEDYNNWDILRTPFRGGASGSKIIVTSRSENTARIMKSGPFLNLPRLSDDDCWSLFAKIAFCQRDPSSYPLLEEIGKKIVERCDGLPLAAKSLGGLLRPNLDVEEWEDVLKSEFWDLPEDKNGILRALRLSYHYLPPHLKQCFAFCSLFPKNYTFKEEMIVSFWIAQKFVRPPKGRSYEMEGKRCFRELLSKSFFQNADGKSLFVMHDLIHDLAQVVSGQFSFRLDNGNPHEIPGKARHFSYCANSVDGFQEIQAAKEVNRLQTFLPINYPETLLLNDELLDDMFSRQKHLRLLSLESYEITKLPDLIGNLIHLRYLNLSFTSIKQLPEPICRLYNLETLNLFCCYSLTNLPADIGKLLSLRWLNVTGTQLREMPMQTRLLKGLEYL